jgi:tape measure domain-containing protein
MSGNVIGTATIKIVPDVSQFTPQLTSQINQAITQAQARWQQAFENMEDAIRELTNVLRQEMAEVRNVIQTTTTDLATEFNQGMERAENAVQTSGEAIETAIRETATQAEQSADRIARSYADAARKADRHMSGMGGMMGGMLKGGAIAAAAAIGAVGVSAFKAGLDMTGSFDKAEASFTALTGSAAEGKKLLEDVKGFAFKTPFDVKQVADQTRNLLAQGQAYGVTKDNVLQYATAIGDAVALTGGGEIEFQRVTRALGQMGSSSKVMAQDMNQLQQSIPGINVWKELGEGLGVSEAEARKMGEQGLIPGAQAANILTQAMREMPGAAGEMERQASTVTGALQNFKEQATSALTEGMRPFTDALRTFLASTEAKTAIAALGAGFGQLLAAMAPIFPVITQLASTFGGFLGQLGKALGPVMEKLGPVFSQLLTNLAGPLSVVAETFGMLLVAAMPIVQIFAQLLSVGAGLIGTVLKALQPAIEAIGKALGEMMKVAAPIITQMGNQLGPIFEQVAVAIGEILIALVPLLPALLKMSMSMMPIAMKLLPIFADLLVVIADALVELLPALLPIINAFATLSAGMAQMLATIVGGIASALSWIIGGLANIAGEILGFLARLVTSVLNFLGISSPSKVFMDIGIAIITGLLNGVQSMVGAVLGFFLALPGRILSGVSKLIGLMLSFGASVLRALWSGISSMAGFIISAAAGIAGWVMSGVASLASKALSAGRNFVEGIWDGISNAAGWLGNKISSFATGLVNKFKSAFTIGSPSKRMAEEIGVPLAQGIAMGFAQELGSIGAGMSANLNVATVSTAASSANGGITFNGPVTFGSDAASSVAELDWMRRTRMGAA